ncbi:NADH-quinone oxidoreductase subunit K [Kocuria sp. CPCC 205235]|uniref:NADH-quinone oxidoreductase subunit K n=1 Tax=Kocuria TaxID=57493 RepID=UPI0021A4A11F|nr:NADH-quinone oxidoreductase subunit K [Kocuria carniphila]MCT1802257.1 NADH-quinone oxidoreductase subunit K [Kocuria carniphila]
MELLLSVAQFYSVLGLILVVAGMVRMLVVQDLMARLVAMNVVGVGSLLILLALAARSDPLDPVLSALVITGLVITVAFTGVGAILIRRIESPESPGGDGS